MSGGGSQGGGPKESTDEWVRLLGAGSDDSEPNFSDEMGNASGDVITEDGEVIGTWNCYEDVTYSFTPDGETEPKYRSQHLGLLVGDIRRWLKLQKL